MRLTSGWEDLNLPDGHISFYLRNNPEVKEKCQEEADCPYKVGFLNKKSCKGESNLFKRILHKICTFEIYVENSSVQTKFTLQRNFSCEFLF